jgi:hypothetical protein
MNLVKTIDQYDNKHLFFCEPIKNNIMNEGNFIRIIYSNSLFVLNGLNILLPLNNIHFEKYYNKYKCSFSLITNKEIVDILRGIEEDILKRVNIKNKSPQCKIYEQMKNGCIKLFLENNNSLHSSQVFILKISGIWETEYHYGLTYKFIQANHL